MAQTIFSKVISPVKGVIDKATSNDKTPTPGYLFNEINKLTYSSVEACQDVEDYLFVRLKKDEVNIKLKVLRVIKHTLLKGHKSFRLGLQRRTSSIQEYLSYRGPADPVYGDSQNKTIRDEAQEIMTLLFTEGVGGGNETYGKGESSFSSSSSSDSSHYSHSFVGGKVMQSAGNFFPSSSPSSVTERMFNSIKEIPKKIVNVVSKEEEGGTFDPHVHWSNKSFTLSNTSGLPPSSQMSVDIGYRSSKPGLPGGSWASSSSSSSSPSTHQQPQHNHQQYTHHNHNHNHHFVQENFTPENYPRDHINNEDDEDDSDYDSSSDDDDNNDNTFNNINDKAFSSQDYHNITNNNNHVNNNTNYIHNNINTTNNFNTTQNNQLANQPNSSISNESQINNGMEGKRGNSCHMTEEDKQYILQTIEQITGSGGGIRNDLTKSELSLFHQRVSNFDLHFVITIIYDKFESSVWQVRYRSLCLFEFIFKSPLFFNSNLSLFSPYYNPSKLLLLQSSTQKSIRDKLRSLLSSLPSSSPNLPQSTPSPVDNNNNNINNNNINNNINYSNNQTHPLISDISLPINNQAINNIFNNNNDNNNNNNNKNILLIDLS